MSKWDTTNFYAYWIWLGYEYGNDIESVSIQSTGDGKEWESESGTEW